MNSRPLTAWDLYFAHAVQGLMTMESMSSNADIEETIHNAAQIATKMAHARDSVLQASGAGADDDNCD
jgi:hypothetical protein